MILSKGLWLVGLAIIAAAVWGNSYYSDFGLLYRVIGVIALFSLGLFVLRFTEFGSVAFQTIKQSTTEIRKVVWPNRTETCLLYTSPSPRDGLLSRMPSSA